MKFLCNLGSSVVYMVIDEMALLIQTGVFLPKGNSVNNIMFVLHT